MKQTASQPDTSMFPTHVIFVSRMFLTPKSIKNFPISTPTQIQARHIAKAAIIMTQIGKNFVVIKPGMWTQITYFHFHRNYLQK